MSHPIRSRCDKKCRSYDIQEKRGRKCQCKFEYKLSDLLYILTLSSPTPGRDPGGNSSTELKVVWLSSISNLNFLKRT